MKGWVRYWICDKSGIGANKWIYLYMPGWTTKGDIKENIIHVHESWAQWADSYSMEVELDVEPPDEEIDIAIDHYETLARDYGNIAAGLRKELEARNASSFPTEPDSSGS